MPSRRRTSPSASPSGAGSRLSTRSDISSRTTSAPKRRNAWASSTPTAPPPSTSRRRGTDVIAVASRLVQTPSSSRRPGTGGTIGSEPVATTTCSAVCLTPSTSTTPVPASRALARSSVMFCDASHCSWPASEWSETMKSRHANAASTSTCALAAASRAACAASPGRSSVLDGMHAQYEHWPPTSSRSTSATRSPWRARPRAVLARRSAADHDDVVVARVGARHRAAPSRAKPGAAARGRGSHRS
jgi:hypothetical protein